MEEIRIAAMVRVCLQCFGSEGTMYILPGERMAQTQHGEVSRGCAIAIDAKVFGIGMPILSALFLKLCLQIQARKAWHVPFARVL